MPRDILENVWKRVRTAAEILRFEDEIIGELTTFKGRHSMDIAATVDGKKRRLKAVRVWHRGILTDAVRKGGNRYMEGITLGSLESHAVEMSLKCWIHKLPFAGAKGGIDVDPYQCTPAELEQITYRFVDELNEVRMIGPFLDVPAPDIGTNPWIMFLMAERFKYLHRGEPFVRAVVTGKPVTIHGDYVGGIEGRTEATGYGLKVALEELRKPCYDLFTLNDHPSIAIQGFGNVGMHAALFAHQNGYRVIAISDKLGGVFQENGLPIPQLIEYSVQQKIPTVAGFPRAEPINNKEFFELPCDVLWPCALEEVITAENADRIRAKVILEGANGPTTPEADAILENNGKIVVPDIYANSMGVVVSFFEWALNTNNPDTRVPRIQKKATVLKTAETMMRDAGREIVERHKKYNVSLRLAAYILALEKAELIRARRIPEYAAKIIR